MKNIKLLREKFGMTQKDLAEIIDVSVRTISSWERGTKPPTLEHLIDLADIFKTSIDFIVGREANNV